MSPWLMSFDCLTAIFKIRALPGGWLGLFMVIAFLLDRASDLTSALVQSVSVQSRCQFGTGLVVTGDVQMNLVPWNGAPYTVVSQAQVTSLLNGGLQGVYRKANRDTHFSADDSDLLGGWQCDKSDIELDYAWDVAVKDIEVDLYQRGLLYGNPQAVGATIDGAVSHLVILDSSAGNETGVLFDVRISIDTTALGNDTKHMESYKCVLQDTYGQLQQIQKGINSLETLGDWKQIFQGSVFEGTGTPASNDSLHILERGLNSMTMIAGGANYLLDSSHSGDTQGCLVSRTRILWELIILSGLTLLIMGFLLLHWIVTAIRVKIAGTHNHEDAVLIEKSVPVGSFGWMTEAVHEFHQPQSVSVKLGDLKKYQFGRPSSGVGYGILGRKDTTEYSEESIALRSTGASRVSRIAGSP